MAEVQSFDAQARTASGKGAARVLRRAGRTPAVIYGEGQPQQTVSVEARLLKRALLNPRFYSTLYPVRLDGKEIRVLPREVQVHPVTDEPIHADFVRVSKGATITVEIPVTFINEEECPGLKRGGVLNIIRREIELSCPADAIPAEITVDLAGFDINDSLHISHVALPAGAELTITDRDFTIATISPPTVAVEEEEEAEAEAAAEEAEAEEAAGEAPAEPPAGERTEE